MVGYKWRNSLSNKRISIINDKHKYIFVNTNVNETIKAESTSNGNVHYKAINWPCSAGQPFLGEPDPEDAEVAPHVVDEAERRHHQRHHAKEEHEQAHHELVCCWTG